MLRKKKTSLLSVLDIGGEPFAIGGLGLVARLVNRFWRSTPPVAPMPFEVHADGIIWWSEEFAWATRTCVIRWSAMRCCRTREYRRRFARNMTRRSGCGSGTATSSTPRSSPARTSRWVGKSFGQVGLDRGGLHPVDAFLDLVVEHGTKVRWRTTISITVPKCSRNSLGTTASRWGFSDAGRICA